MKISKTQCVILFGLAVLVSSCAHTVPNLRFCSDLIGGDRFCKETISGDEYVVPPGQCSLDPEIKCLHTPVEDVGKALKFMEDVCEKTQNCVAEDVEEVRAFYNYLIQP